MKKAKVILSVVLALVLTLSMVACTSKETPKTPSGGSADGEKVKLGLSWFSMTDEHLAKIYTELEKAVKDQGLEDKVELIMLDANMDAAKQNSQIDNLIAQGVDAIIMIPFDRQQQVPAVQAAKDAGIPMIELCASTEATDIRTSYVGSEDIASGRILMKHLAETCGGKGNVVVLHGPAGQNAEVMRHTGAQEVLNDYPDMKIVAEKYCDWDRAKAMSAMENILQADMDVTVVFAQDDGMAMGALEAIEGSGSENIIIGGIDGIPDAMNAVKDGRLACTVYQNAREQAIKVLDVALKAAAGETVEKMYDVPYELVTKENVADYMD